MIVNDYEFNFEGLPNSIQADSGNVQIVADRITIEVLDGTLRVNKRSYGAIKPKDRITINGDSVRVNGNAREKSE